MKKFLIILIFLFGTSNEINAQRIFNIGFKVGANMHTPEFTSLSNVKALKDNHWGFNLGLSTRFKFLFMSLQPEVIFSHHATQVKISDSGIDDIVNGKFSDVTIPLMLNFHFFKVMHAGLGPMYSFQFPSFSNNGGNHWDQLKNNFNAGSFGLQFGLGVDFWRMYVDVNYQVGIGKYKSSMEIDGTTYRLDARPNTLWLTVGIWFLNPKGKKKGKK